MYLDFLQRHRILRTKLLNQAFLNNRLILSSYLSKGCSEDINTLLEKYSVSCAQMAISTPPIFIEVPVPSKEIERSCMYVLGVSILELLR